MEKVTKRVNFSTQEKEELISLVSKYRDIIENKKTNGVSTKDKDHGWEQLNFEFNSKGLNTFRTKDQLKKYWANLKQLQRQAAATQKINRIKTEGGPFESQNEPDETVLEIINCKTVVGLDNPYVDESVLDKSLFVVTETENQIEDCAHVEFQSSQFSVSDNSTFIRPKTDNILNCKQLTNVCEDSQDGDNKPKAKQQKNKCKIPSNDPPKIVDLKAQYLGYQIEEMKERLEIKKEERAFQAKLQALQIKQKEVELEIMLQQKRKLMFENEALENEIKKKCKQ